MNFSRITYEVSARRARICLNRPDKRNALDDVMVDELISAFVSAGEDASAKVILLSSKGSAFCAGADLEYLQRMARFSLEENRKDSERLSTLFQTIYELKKPVIAVVGGPALAGGCGLASVCDFIVASKEKATFGYTEVRIGFVPAVVMPFLVKRVGEGKARELILRGIVLTATEALEAGLVNLVIPETLIEQRAEDLAEELILQNSSDAMGLCKALLSKLSGMDTVSALRSGASINADARMTEDCRKGIEAFLGKKKPLW